MKLNQLWARLRGQTTAEVVPAPSEAATAPRHANVVAGSEGGPWTCPCCGHRTLPQRGAYDWCQECSWEDDGQDEHDLDVVRSGPNGSLSLRQARAEYVRRGGDRQPHDPPPVQTG